MDRGQSISIHSFLLLFLAIIFLIYSGQVSAADKSHWAKYVKMPSGVSGWVKFEETKAQKVRVVANLQNLPPGGIHGIHIHERGECVPPDFKSAGPHFSPLSNLHGDPQKPQHHVGDLGNWVANEKGNIQEAKTFDQLSLDSNSKSYIGYRSLILHIGKDKFVQPAGAAGKRIACSLIAPSQ